MRPKRYDETVEKLSKDPIIRRMAKNLVADGINPEELANDHGFVEGTLNAYQEQGGMIPTHTEGPAEAVRRVAENAMDNTTPRPWFLLSGNGDFNISRTTGPEWAKDDNFVGIFSGTKEDAEAFTHAVNTHDELVEALGYLQSVTSAFLGDDVETVESEAERLRSVRTAERYARKILRKARKGYEAEGRST